MKHPNPPDKCEITLYFMVIFMLLSVRHRGSIELNVSLNFNISKCEMTSSRLLLVFFKNHPTYTTSFPLSIYLERILFRVLFVKVFLILLKQLKCKCFLSANNCLIIGW